MRMSLFASLAALECVLGAAAGPVRAQEATGSFQRSLDTGQIKEVDVSTGSGAISAHRGDAGRIEVKGEIRVRERRGRSQADAEEIVRRLQADPPIETAGDVLRIGRIDDPDLRENVTMSYEISLPADLHVNAEAGSGRISLSQLSGGARAEAGSGEIMVSNVSGGVELRAGSGTIRATGVMGGLRAMTGSGDIVVERSGPGDVEVTAGSGDDVRLTGLEGSLSARTGSGDVEVDGRPAGTWGIETGSGDLTVRLPDDASFDLSARTGSGDIDVQQPLTVQGRVEHGELNGKVRGGGPLLRLRTGSGDVRIE
ncbi:MAG TPA: DUF4097 family beta strand repeat-containing protein [Gammaproteobacteria bacterium]|nr:DUF4097 family beta strand repeat-containing protein [Gammaproteobacteria bacterium]